MYKKEIKHQRQGASPLRRDFGNTPISSYAPSLYVVNAKHEEVSLDCYWEKQSSNNIK